MESLTMNKRILTDDYADGSVTSSYATGTRSSSGSGLGSSNAAQIIGIAVPIISLILAIIIFFAFVIRKKDPKSKFAKWCKEFLNFRKIWLAGIMKFIYLFSLIATTLGGLVYMFIGDNDPLANILAGLAIIVFGNIGLRISLEILMLLVGLWENSADIRTDLSSIRKKFVGEERVVMVKEEHSTDEMPSEPEVTPPTPVDPGSEPTM